MLASIPFADLKLLLPFRGRDIRSYLNGVIIRPVESGGCLLMASNGHVMAIYHSAKTRCDKARIVGIASNFEQATRSIRFPSDSVLTINDEDARIVIGDPKSNEEWYVGPMQMINIDPIPWPDWMPRRTLPPAAQAAAHHAAESRITVASEAGGS